MNLTPFVGLAYRAVEVIMRNGALREHHFLLVTVSGGLWRRDGWQWLA